MCINKNQNDNIIYDYKMLRLGHNIKSINLILI